MAYYHEWKPYVSVATRRYRAKQEMQRLRKRGVDIQPVEIEGRKIARTFWGEAWCKHMEAQGDFANRLPRGRTYVRNGSVCHLSIGRGKIEAMVSGSEIYNVSIEVELVARKQWTQLKRQCSGQIGSLLELLQGRISDGVMEIMTDPDNGLFPLPTQIDLDCDCPDYATMCKHAAAVLYGVGARLDRQPELLFQLRGVNHLDLITASTDEAVDRATKRGKRQRVANADLGEVFGIEFDDAPQSRDEPASTPVAQSPQRKTPEPKSVKNRVAKESAGRPTQTAASGKSKRATVNSRTKVKQKDAAEATGPKQAKKKAKRVTKKKGANRKTVTKRTAADKAAHNSMPNTRPKKRKAAAHKRAAKRKVAKKK